MRKFKEEIMQGTFVSSINSESKYNYHKYIAIGKNRNEEYRGIINIKLNQIKFFFIDEDNVLKVELCLYLVDLKIEKHIENFMLSIGINIEDIPFDQITYSNAPKFYQKCGLYVIKNEYKNQYINLDITHIIKELIKGEKNDYGITLIGINEGAFAIVNSLKSSDKPYLKLLYKREVAKKNEFKEINSYGLFINENGQFLESTDMNLIIWNNKFGNGLKIINKVEILVKYTGMYQVDYEANIISDFDSYMVLIRNGEELVYSKIKVGNKDFINHGSTIVEIKDENSIIMVGIKSEKMCFETKDISANLRIIKI